MGRIPPECSELLSTVVCYMSGSKLPKKASRTRLGDHGAVCSLHVLVCARARLGHTWAEGSHVLCLLSVGPAWERRLERVCGVHWGRVPTCGVFWGPV